VKASGTPPWGAAKFLANNAVAHCVREFFDQASREARAVRRSSPRLPKPLHRTPATVPRRRVPKAFGIHWTAATGWTTLRGYCSLS